MNNKPESELYIHIPFCARKCSYCDFCSFPAGRPAQKAYADALKKEIAAADGGQYTVRSVFIGGGTPSLLCAGDIRDILSVVNDHFRMKKDAEITIEANPCTVTSEKLSIYLESGINRISLGAQSIFDPLLKLLGRLHDAQTFWHILEMVRSAGFQNINVDLMSGLPELSPEMWRETLYAAAEQTSVRHISAYSLTLEEGTPLYAQQNSLCFPSEDDLAQMYADTADVLAQYGFCRYEISNYAKKGYECVHNTGYWTGVPYYGFGLGASSFTGTARYRNTEDLSFYLENVSTPERLREEFYSLDRGELASEFMILGLRMTAGISCSEFTQRFGVPAADFFPKALHRHLKMGTLVQDGDRIRIPEQYLFVSNGILADFM